MTWAHDGEITTIPVASETDLRAAPAGRRAMVVCDQWLGSNGYAGMKALRRAGWNVLVVPEWEYVPVRWASLPAKIAGRMLRALAVREFNQALLRQAARFRPEFLLVFKGTFLRAATLRALRRQGVRCYCFFPDVSFRAHGPSIPDALREYDWIFSTKSFGLEDMRVQLGITRTSLLHHAFDPDLHRPLELNAADRARFDCDVSFIGTWSPKKEALLASLLELRPKLRVRVWGEQWHNVPADSVLRRVVEGHEAAGEDYVRAIRASRINLGILSEIRVGASSGDQVTSRTFHIPACGGFLLHERTPEVLTLFREDVDIACFSGVEEMVRQIDLHLDDPARREAIAARAQELVWERHGWDARVREILAQHLEGTA